MNFTIITGLSGAGRSSALKIMEDLGYFCADNIPPQLIPDFARLCQNRAVPLEMWRLWRICAWAICSIRSMRPSIS